MSALSGIAERLREGRFAEALEAAKAAVRSGPMDLSARRLLFELFAAAGDWRRCRDQAEALGNLGDGGSDWIGILGVLSSCEARERFWTSGGPVEILGALDEWDFQLLESARSAASQASGSGWQDALLRLREFASDLAFGPGKLDGEPFENLATMDDRLPGCLEVAMDGAYFWLWLGSVKFIEFSVRPGSLTDLRWMPARFALEDGSKFQATIFGCYPGTESSEHEESKIGTAVHWQDLPEDLAVGAGPQVLAVDGGARALHGIGMIEFLDGSSETNTTDVGGPESKP